MKRRSPTMTEIAASALLHMAVSDGKGGVTYLFTFAERKSLEGATADQIVSLFQIDHDHLHTYGGTMHPTNLTPRLIANHRTKTSRDIKEVRKADRISAVVQQHRVAVAVKAGHEPDKQPDMPGTKREWFESDAPDRKADKSKSKWGARPMQSKPFQKGHRPMRGKAG